MFRQAQHKLFWDMEMLKSGCAVVDFAVVVTVVTFAEVVSVRVVTSADVVVTAAVVTISDELSVSLFFFNFELL